MPDDLRGVENAIRDTLISPNEADSNLEPANVVDGLYVLARSVRAVGTAQLPNDTPRLSGEPFTLVDGLYAIAQAIDHLAEAIEGRSV